MECFPTWLVYALGTALVLAGAQMAIFAVIGIRSEKKDAPATETQGNEVKK
jgi:hypothetical protein